MTAQAATTRMTREQMDALVDGHYRAEEAGDLKAIVDGEFSIDLTRKHVAGERAVWTLRMRDRPGSLGQVEVGFRDGRVAELRLGPATAER